MATQAQKLDYLVRFQQSLTAMFEAQQALLSLQAKAQMQGIVITESQMVGEFEGMTPEQWQAGITATVDVITGIPADKSAAMAMLVK